MVGALSKVFFFFQAGDCIRDFHVTGVQTCALPISLRDLRLQTETGMFVLAVQRGRRWIYRPRAGLVFEAGDRIIAVGPEDGTDELETLCRAPQPASETG